MPRSFPGSPSGDFCLLYSQSLSPGRRFALSAAPKQCVIFNPAAARGRAGQRLDALRAELGGQADFRPTQRAGHAEELAYQAAQDGYAEVVAAGGDGTVHEAANGLLRAQRPDVTFRVLPLGSANDYYWSLCKIADPARPVRALDAAWVQDGTGRGRYFVNTLGLGFSGAVTVESRRIRRLRGLPLYALAFVRALCWRYACPAMTITFDGAPRTAPTLSLTLAIAHREGNLVVAPHAELDDGLFDYLHVGCLARWEVLRYLPRLASGGELPKDHPAIWLGRCRAVHLESAAPLTVHLDGEFFSRPEDDVRQLEVRILPGALRVRTLADPSDPFANGAK
jgi:diacylglycerol kinase family enzyme